MLSGDFFQITSLHTREGSVEAVLEIQSKHTIFDGHFPGQPVVPGVCMLQIIKELLEKTLGQPTRLLKAEQLKFLAVINPVVQVSVRAHLKYYFDENGRINLSATISNEEVIYFKMSGTFITCQLPAT